MAAIIDSLIDKRDNVEIVRDKIASILKEESANQESLAQAAGEDPRLWKLKVFVERSNPWSDYRDEPSQLDASRLVNVSLENENFDKSKSDTVRRQMATATYYLDCYGYGVSEESIGGHKAGDGRAAVESQRCLRLVRNILMSGHYARLGMRGVVWSRWPSSVQVFQPAIDGQAIQNLIATRLSLEVQFNELSPQVEGEALETIFAEVKLESTGEVVLSSEFDVS